MHPIPEFDSLHPWQAKSALNKAPDMEGSGKSIAPNLINELIESCEHVVDAGNDCVYVGIQTMLELAFVPYQPTLSLGGSGGSSDKKGWNDDDKYQRRHSVYRSSKKSGSLHR